MFDSNQNVLILFTCSSLSVSESECVCVCLPWFPRLLRTVSVIWIPVRCVCVITTHIASCWEARSVIVRAEGQCVWHVLEYNTAPAWMILWWTWWWTFSSWAVIVCVAVCRCLMLQIESLLSPLLELRDTIRFSSYSFSELVAQIICHCMLYMSSGVCRLHSRLFNQQRTGFVLVWELMSEHQKQKSPIGAQFDPEGGSEVPKGCLTPTNNKRRRMEPGCWKTSAELRSKTGSRTSSLLVEKPA